VVVDPTVLPVSDRGELSGPLAAREFSIYESGGGGTAALKK
jgi:hypothetical protein